MKDPGTAGRAASFDGGGEWFRTLADKTSTALFVFRERFIYVNRASAELSGYTTEELLQMSVWDLIHPDFQEPVREQSRRRQRGEEASDRYELKIVRKDGERKWIDFTAGSIEVDGKPATVGTAFDITVRKETELELVKSEERLNLAQHAARSLSWEWDLVTDRIEFSPFADILFGFPAHGVVTTGEQFVRYLHEEDRPRLERAIRRALKGAGDLSVEVRLLPPNGGVRWLAEKALVVRDESGRGVKLIGAAHDITERKIAEDGLFQEKERALVTLASIADGVIRTDADGLIDYINPVAQKLTGWKMAEAYGRPVDDAYKVIDEATGQQQPSPVDRCLGEQRNVMYPGDRSLVRRDGTRFAIHDSAAPIRNREGLIIGAILVFRDLTHLREIEKEMAHLASHDPLTGLLNRREFEVRLEEALSRGRPDGGENALCYMDLDQFKLVNDTCGHTAGDQLVLQVGSIIRARLGDRDVLGRLGGDEFGILMRDRSPAAARELAQDVVDAISHHRFAWQDRIHDITVSAGLVPLEAGSQGLASLLSAADAACYVAKERGGNRIHEYEPGDTVIARRHGEMQWISRIHKAFDERRFDVYRQRIQPLDDDGLEDLSELFIRLRDESGEVIEPQAFIPAAEKYGLIVTIDRWMVSSALDHLASRQPDGAAPHFAVNVSGQSVSDSDFLDFVVERFAHTRVEPGQILFEITETSAIADLPHAMRFISVLRGMGCRFVLDDFGKGLSSFSYLQSLPVDFLKIDGSFVRNLTTNSVQAALVSSIHDVGKVLGMRTIAESVEDAATLDALRSIGVHYAQGFHIARPEPLPGERIWPNPAASRA